MSPTSYRTAPPRVMSRSKPPAIYRVAREYSRAVRPQVKPPQRSSGQRVVAADEVSPARARPSGSTKARARPCHAPLESLQRRSTSRRKPFQRPGSSCSAAAPPRPSAPVRVVPRAVASSSYWIRSQQPVRVQVATLPEQDDELPARRRTRPETQRTPGAKLAACAALELRWAAFSRLPRTGQRSLRNGRQSSAKASIPFTSGTGETRPAGVACVVSQLLLDAEQLVVLGVRSPRQGAPVLICPRFSADRQVGDRRVLRLARAVGDTQV